MTRLSAMHGGINLAQGFPNFPAPPQVKDAAKRAIDADINQYAIIVNSPNNPTGRVFTRTELETIARLCREHDVIAVTDEIYEHILYEGEHIPIATLAGMAERTVTISGASKTFSVTGWRVGWIVAPPELTAAIRKVHDFVTVGAPAPFQEAIATPLDMGRPYYDRLATEYGVRRDHLVRVLA